MVERRSSVQARREEELQDPGLRRDSEASPCTRAHTQKHCVIRYVVFCEDNCKKRPRYNGARWGPEGV
eukprot:6223583-Prymnesium_polylepis.1